ncbi:MAG TPA: four helix bundle protein [Gemmatimonadales bacterium]|nr:four helix bundle protein [Gemmatimonadales bacterium]
MRDHKSIVAWQEAHKVVEAVLEGSRTCWRPYAAAVFSQLQRASLSVQLNIAEGYALISPRRFKNHLEIAYGSAVETQELLEILTGNNLLPDHLGREAIQNCARSQRLLLGLIKRYRDQGP